MISLKTNKKIIVFISIFLVLLVGCSNGTKIKGNKIVGDKIVVEKRVGEADKYEYCNEIKDSKGVQMVNHILDNISWTNAEVSMVHPPDYKFHFENTNGNASGAVYELWISPDKGGVELVIDSESKYIHLNKEKSLELFKIITGKKLDEV